MGGSKGGTSTSQVTIPPAVLARYQSVNDTAQQVASTPFQQYSSDPSAFVAPLNSTQQAGIANTNSASGQAQPFYQSATNTLADATNAYRPYNAAATTGALGAYGGAQPYQDAATGLAAGSTAPITAQNMDIGSYLSPYLGTVLGSTASLLNQNNQQQQSGQLGTAIKSGAFGGDRAGIAAANLEQQQNLANANIYSGIANQGYTSALGAAQTQANANRSALLSGSNALAGIGQQGYAQGMGLSQQLSGLGQANYGVGANTATTLAGLGSGAQAASLQGAQAQLAAGQGQQQTDQAGKTALYNQFLQKQSYPFQTAQFLANIAEGTGSLSGNTTTTNTVQNGIFSDRRLKHDIKPIGKTFDGQTIYSFRYNGDKHTEMGLIAQEVEKKHPKAVGLAGGFKTVDYEHATRDAAEKGHFATGGLVGANDNREAYYAGGMAASGLGGGGFDPAALSQMYANYQAMYGPLYGHGAAGGPGATGGVVPSASLPVGQLHPAEAQVPQQNLANTVKSDADAATALGSLGDKFGLWNYGHGSDGAGKDKLDQASSKYEDRGLYDDPGMARGGLARAGGGATPYEGSQDLAIPDDQQHYQMLKPADGKPVDSGGDAFASTLKSVASIIPFVLATGGRANKPQRTHVKSVGKTDDGQTIYSYRHKGDPTTRMGFAEVEDTKPAARGGFAAGGTPDDDTIADTIAKALEPRIDPSMTDSNYPILEGPAKSAPAAKVDEYAGSDGPAPKPSVKPQSDDMAMPSNIPVGAKVNPSTAKSYTAVAQYFLNRGYTPGQSQGIAAGAIAESGGNPSAVNKASGAFGIGQWLGARKSALMSKYGTNPSLDQQLDFLHSEIQGGDRGGKAILAQKDPVAVANAYITQFMRPAKGAETTGDMNRALKALGVAQRASGGRTAFADGGTDFENTFGDITDPEDPKKKAIDAALALSDAARAPVPDTAKAPVPDAFQKPGDDAAAAWPTPTADAFQKPSEDAPSGLAAATPSTTPAPRTDTFAQPGGLLPADDSFHNARDVSTTPKHGFFEGLKHGDATSIIPLLTGIGALATTPTNNPLTALAAGLGAGAQAAQGQNQFALEKNKAGSQRLLAEGTASRLPLEALRARSEWQSVINGTTSNIQAWLDKYQGIAQSLDTQGRHDPILARQIAQANAKIAENTGTGSAGDVSPAQPTVDASNPASLRRAGLGLSVAGNPGGSAMLGVASDIINSGKNVNPDGTITPAVGAVPTAITEQVARDIGKSNTAIKNEATATANSASTEQMKARMLEQSLTSGVDKNGNPIFANLGGPIGNKLTNLGTYMVSAGFSPKLVDAILHTDVTKAAEVKALQTQLVTATASDLGKSVFRSPAELQYIAQSTPGSQLPSRIAYEVLKRVTEPQLALKINRGSYINSLDASKDDFAARDNAWVRENYGNYGNPGGTTAQPKAKSATPAPPAGLKEGQVWHGWRKDSSAPHGWTKVS